MDKLVMCSLMVDKWTKDNFAKAERQAQGLAVNTSRLSHQTDRGSFEPNRSSQVVWLDSWTSPQ